MFKQRIKKQLEEELFKRDERICVLEERQAHHTAGRRTAGPKRTGEDEDEEFIFAFNDNGDSDSDDVTGGAVHRCTAGPKTTGEDV